MTGKRNHTSPIDSPTSENIADKDQDRFLPIANVSRIMKKSLPANAKISKDAKETVQECVSEFISFITGEASDKCQKEKRKTINGDDLLWAMTTLGFENYVGPLKVYLNKYRETEGEKNSMARLEEISPNPNPNLDPNPNHSAVNKGNNSFCLSGTNSDFHNFNMGFYSIGAQVTPKGSGENTRVIGYGESLGSEAFNLIRVHENGDENGDCRSAMASHVHGVDW